MIYALIVVSIVLMISLYLNYKFIKSIFSLEDAINNIADLYSMTQTLIKDSVDQHRRAQEQAITLRKTFLIYDNQDVQRMAKIMSVCEETLTRVINTLIKASRTLLKFNKLNSKIRMDIDESEEEMLQDDGRMVKGENQIQEEYK